MKLKIKNIFAGSEKQLQKGKNSYPSSYEKQKISQAKVNKLGIIEDNQSDKSCHGGEYRALCIYTQGAYDLFKEKYNIDLPLCALGENITLDSCDDRDICLGDIYKCGEIEVKVTQPRQPCWKISSVLGIKNMTASIVKEGQSGFYLKILKEGLFTQSDSFELIKRKNDKLNIKFINDCYYNAKDNQENIKMILACEDISPAYRIDLEKRYKNKEFGLESYQKDKI